MTPLGLILALVLTACHPVSGWMFHYPLTAREGQKQLLFTITSDDDIGPDPPYIFQVWKNVTGQPNVQVQLQYVSTTTNTTQFYWDNDQPAGTVIMFQLTDNTGRPARSPTVEVSPNLVVSASVISTMSTASVGSVRATQTTSTPTTSTSASPTTSSAPTSSQTPDPVKMSGGAIAGSVVGGALILAVIVGALVLCLRRRRPQQTPDTVDLNTDGPSLTPFVYDNPYHAHSAYQQPYDPVSRPVQVVGPQPGAEEAPPIYSPRSPTSETSYTQSSYTYTSQASASTFRVVSGPPNTSDRKGTYARVSSDPH